MNISKVYLLTGSNIGDSLQNLLSAIEEVELLVGKVVQQSPFYRTAPWGNIRQQDFYNQVLCVETSLSPDDVLNNILKAEQNLGRKREEKWGPRIIDIDILFYNNEIINKPDLTVPHPFLHERRFTLAPLNDLAPQFIHPVFNKTIQQLLNECADAGTVEKL